MNCPKCQSEVEQWRPTCKLCGTPVDAAPIGAPGPDLQGAPGSGIPPVYMAPSPPRSCYPEPPPTPSSAPAAGGVLVIIGGVLAVVNGILLAAAGSAYPALPGFREAMALCAAGIFVFATIAVVGGICAFYRRAWGLALAGSVLCMLSIGPLAISFILGLIGLVLIAVSRNEFV
jgi:hypothetical protein